MTPRTTREDWPSGGRFRSVRVVPKQESQNERIETCVRHLQHDVFPLTTESPFYSRRRRAVSSQTCMPVTDLAIGSLMRPCRNRCDEESERITE
jgi:hypothetical protein